MALGGNAILCAELTDPATVSLRMWYGHGADGWKAVDRARYDLGLPSYVHLCRRCVCVSSVCLCMRACAGLYLCAASDTDVKWQCIDW